MLEGQEIDAEARELAVAELTVAGFIPEVAGEIVVEIERRVRGVVENGREVVDGVEFHHEPDVDHHANDAGIGGGVDEPRADDGGFRRVVAEDAGARGKAAAVRSRRVGVAAGGGEERRGGRWGEGERGRGREGVEAALGDEEGGEVG